MTFFRECSTIAYELMNQKSIGDLNPIISPAVPVLTLKVLVMTIDAQWEASWSIKVSIAAPKFATFTLMTASLKVVTIEYMNTM